MKKFPYRVLFACIFLPPIFYILTLNLLEGYLQGRMTSTLNYILVQDNEALYEGRYSVREEINRNIGEYLSANRFMYYIGIRTGILVKTKNNQILYPAELNQQLNGFSNELSADPLNYMDMAAENFKILNEGLILTVDVRIKHNGWLSNCLLSFYVLLAVFIVRKIIRRSESEIEKIEKQRQQAIVDLSVKLEDAESGLSEIMHKEEDYLKDIEDLKNERKNLSTDIDGLLEEIERLEAGLQAQRDLRKLREEEAFSFREEIEILKVKQDKPKKKNQKVQAVAKRFKVLYKNLVFNDRALDGFMSISDEFQLKAEEIIHRLNEDPSQVSVKRKVFSKGGKINVFEVEFAYSGRIYFQKESQTRVSIVAIGTKKTQDQDLAFLEREIKR